MSKKDFQGVIVYPDKIAKGPRAVPIRAWYTTKRENFPTFPQMKEFCRLCNDDPTSLTCCSKTGTVLIERQVCCTTTEGAKRAALAFREVLRRSLNIPITLQPMPESQIFLLRTPTP